MNDFESFYRLQGRIEVPAGVDFDTFCDKFQEAMKILGWRFAGFFEDADSFNRYVPEYKEAENATD